MSRAVLVLRNAGDRACACKWVMQADDWSRVEFKGAKRTLPQNDRMWAMLTDVARQKEHFGRKYDTQTWKKIFMAELGRESQFVPSLYGEQPIEIGNSSSDLSKEEMADLITLMMAWGDQNGIVFHDADRERRESLGELA